MLSKTQDHDGLGAGDVAATPAASPAPGAGPSGAGRHSAPATPRRLGASQPCKALEEGCVST
jgi:hypothetical protein